MSKIRDVLISKELVRIAANTTRPSEISDPHSYIRDVNDHSRGLLLRIRSISDSVTWRYMTPTAFEVYASELTELQRFGLFYADQLHQAQIFVALTAWKMESMLRSLVRSVNCAELVTPALLSRSLMETATSALFHVRESLGVFNAVANSEQPIRVPPEQMKRIEERLLRAIWGTRINTSKLHDKSPLWKRSPYTSGEQMNAENVLGPFQQLAKHDSDVGEAAYRVYEWLCDIIHPATQGLRLFWDHIVETAPGKHSVFLKCTGSADQAFTNALVLWGTGYSSVMQTRLLDVVATVAPNVQKKLETAYGFDRRFLD